MRLDIRSVTIHVPPMRIYNPELNKEEYQFIRIDGKYYLSRLLNSLIAIVIILSVSYGLAFLAFDFATSFLL